MDHELSRFLLQRRRQASCPDEGLLAGWLEGALADPERVERHVAGCRSCADLLRAVAADSGAVAEALGRALQLQALGLAVGVTGVLGALHRRRAELSASARARLHRGEDAHLGESSALPGRLVWKELPGDPDTYEVGIAGARLRVHGLQWTLDAAAWERLEIPPEEVVPWEVAPLRGGRPCGPPVKGLLWFLDEEEAAEVRRQAAALRDVPHRPVALGSLYRSLGLGWEAYGALREAGDDLLAELLRGEVCQELGLVQEAARHFGRANRVMA